MTLQRLFKPEYSSIVYEIREDEKRSFLMKQSPESLCPSACKCINLHLYIHVEGNNYVVLLLLHFALKTSVNNAIWVTLCKHVKALKQCYEHLLWDLTYRAHNIFFFLIGFVFGGYYYAPNDWASTCILFVVWTFVQIIC